MRRIFALLTSEERGHARWIVASIFVAALLDLVSVVALIPLLFELFSGNVDVRMVLTTYMVALAVVVVKNILTVWLSRRRMRYFLSLYIRMSGSLFKAYYDRGLVFVREKGAVKLGHDVNGVCYFFCMNVLSSIFGMAVNITLLVIGFVALLIYSWKLMLLLSGVMVLFVALYMLVVKQRLRDYGEEANNARRAQSRTSADTFNGYAEMEVNGMRDTMVRHFEDGARRVADCQLRQMYVAQVPSVLNEVFLLVAMAGFAFVGDISGDVALQMGIFALAAMKLLPSLRGVLGNWSVLQNASFSIDIIEKGLVSESAVEPKKVPVESADRKIDDDICIMTEKLSFQYYNKPYYALENFDCKIWRGEYVGIMGESGAGKSTFFNLILGLLRPTSGAVYVNGRLLTDDNKTEWLKHVGYVSQHVFIKNATIEQNIAFGEDVVDKVRVRRVIEMAQLDEWIDSLPDGQATELYESGNNLSGGQRQRIGLARALYKDIDVLLLDEATSSLDYDTEQAICNTLLNLRKECGGLTIVSIAHNERTLEHCDYVMTISN